MINNLEDFIRKKSIEAGFDDIGFTKPTINPQDIDNYLKWVDKGYYADMDYMKKTIRCHPDQLLVGAKTAIIFISNYKQNSQPISFEKDKGLIASYARGRDYHNIHRRRIKKIIRQTEEFLGYPIEAKGFSDSTPILERALAVQAGLGWQGKNNLLIHRKFGTFFFLSGLLTTLEIPFSKVKQYGRIPRCGNCTRCIDACPTNALEKPYLLNANKCLSYHLIESKKEIPKNIKEKNPGYVFGCDLCQDSCPHNVRSPSISEDSVFSSKQGIGDFLDSEKLSSQYSSKESFFGTPLKRKSPEGLKDNLLSLANSKE
jgi:epoxyqueuosine reductase